MSIHVYAANITSLSVFTVTFRLDKYQTMSPK